MKIKLETQKLIDEVTNALEEYDEEYKKLLKLYAKKLNEYLIYVKKTVPILIAKKSGKPLKYPPSRPSYLRDSFVTTLAALQAHRDDYIILDDTEYTQIKEGMNRLRKDITSNTTALMSLGY